MRIGVQFDPNLTTIEEMREVVALTPALDHFFVSDHALLPFGRVCLDAWAVLTALAEVARTPRIGILALCAPLRPVAVHEASARVVRALLGDRGTLVVAVGAGWYKPELPKGLSFAMRWRKAEAVAQAMQNAGAEVWIAGDSPTAHSAATLYGWPAIGQWRRRAPYTSRLLMPVVLGGEEDLRRWARSRDLPLVAARVRAFVGSLNDLVATVTGVEHLILQHPTRETIERIAPLLGQG